MSITAAVAHERRSLWTNSATLAALALALLVSFYALFRGAVHREASASSVRTFVADNESKAKEARDRLIAVEQGTVAAKDDRWAGLAMNVSPAAAAEPGPLADFAVGVSDIQPSVARVTQWRTVDRLFSNYEFESPAAIAAGPFDFAFVVIFILPLLMIVLSYDTLSGEHDGGRLGLLLSHPVSVRRLVFAKLRVRLGAVLAVFLLASVVGFFFGASDADSGHRLGRFVVWTMLGGVYLGWWALLIAWIVSLNRRSETTILAMIALWAFNGLIGPATLAAATESMYPSPSRLGFLSEIRRTSNEAYKSKRELTKGLALEHHDLAADAYSLPEYIRTAFVVTQTVERKVQPIIDEFDATHAARRAFMRTIQYASPAVVALQAFNDVAGTSLDRQKRFEKQARQYKRTLADRLAPNVLAGQRLTVAELDEMPTFVFAESSLSTVLGRTAWPIAFFVVLGLVFGMLARHNLDRLQTRIRER